MFKKKQDICHITPYIDTSDLTGLAYDRDGWMN